MKKIIQSNKAKNTILKALKSSNSVDPNTISTITNIDLDLCFVCVKELQKAEYLEARDTTTKAGMSFLLKSTPKGRLFIKNGGYPSSGIRIVEHAIIIHKTTIISFIALVISILSYFKN